MDTLVFIADVSPDVRGVAISERVRHVAKDKHLLATRVLLSDPAVAIEDRLSVAVQEGERRRALVFAEEEVARSQASREAQKKCEGRGGEVDW